MVMDRLMDQLMDRWMDRSMDGWNNRWTDIPLYKDAIYATENDDFPTDFAIFTKPLWTNQWTNQWTNRETDQPTDRHSTLFTVFRCGYRLSLRGYDRPSVGPLVCR